MKIYLVGLLFSEAGQRWLRGLKAELAEHDYKVIWQYELFNQDEIPSWGDDASKKIMEGGRDALIACNLIVILLDGMQVDNGAALELGFAYAKGIPAVGIRTDARCCGEYAGLFVRLAQKEHGTG